jgi:hypothetical protein
VGLVEPGSEVVVNTDTGEITEDGEVFRPAGPGLDAATGMAFNEIDQGPNAPPLGVFTMGSLEVRDGGTLRGVGANALVLLVDGDVAIGGLVTVAAAQSLGGPGGYSGGGPNVQGSGSCAGRLGDGIFDGDAYCSAGSSGAGFGFSGGWGGNCICGAPSNFVGAMGGAATCGTPELVPLVGGSSGAGGPFAEGTATLTAPGPGGGGGGALQISATGSITVSATGRVNAGGGGGGETVDAGGAGGGAGGALLLEAPTVTIAVGGILAANGGGGGGGDCD